LEKLKLGPWRVAQVNLKLTIAPVWVRPVRL